MIISKKNKNSFSWCNERLLVKNNNTGKGLFTKSKIIKGQLLAVFGGYIMTLKEESTLPNQISDYAHQISDNFVIGIKKTSQIQKVDYFNHSCDPNSGFKGQIFLIAMRDIEVGEEVTFDYAMVLSNFDANAPTYKLKCLCYKTNCRKIITDKDWMKPNLQKKYRGYFQWYIEEKIRKLKKTKNK